MRRHRDAVQVTDATQMLASREKPLSKSTIYRLIQAGELEAYRIGEGRTSKLYIFEDSIEAYKSRRAVVPTYDRKRIRELLAS